MENKNTVKDAKIGNLNELTKVLSVKEQAQEQLLVVMKALGIGKIVRNLKFEKAQGYTLNFVRAFELYERRWGIEVIFKECRGYLGLGKCQSRSYNAQIADTTLCFMMYQMLSLAKRFSKYETLGALFRSERDRLQVLTLWSSTLEEVRHLLEVLSREAGVDLLACLSTVAARQTADFSTKVWAHLLCDSDDYAMPDLD